MIKTMNNGYMIEANQELVVELNNNADNRDDTINWCNFSKNDTFYNDSSEPYRVAEISHGVHSDKYVKLIKSNSSTRRV